VPGSLEEALLGEGESVFRQNGRLAALVTRFFERSRLPHDEPIPGPAVVFQRDATTVLPPGWTARSDASGNLILDALNAQRTANGIPPLAWIPEAVNVTRIAAAIQPALRLRKNSYFSGE